MTQVVNAWPLLVLLLVGMATDALSALYWVSLKYEYRKIASLLSGILIAVSYAAWELMRWSGVDGTAKGIAAYAIGGMIGTYFGTRNLGKKPEDKPKSS